MPNIELISVDDHLPEKDGRYLVCTEEWVYGAGAPTAKYEVLDFACNPISILLRPQFAEIQSVLADGCNVRVNFCIESNSFWKSDETYMDDYVDIAIYKVNNVTHWAELPELPSLN